MAEEHVAMWHLRGLSALSSNCCVDSCGGPLRFLTWNLHFTSLYPLILITNKCFCNHGIHHSIPYNPFSGTKKKRFFFLYNVYHRLGAFELTKGTIMSLWFQLCSGKSGIFSSSQALLVKPVKRQMMGKSKGLRIACQATSISADRVPDMGKRQLMNLLLLGAISLPTAGMLIPYTYFFVPPGYVLFSYTTIFIITLVLTSSPN